MKFWEIQVASASWQVRGCGRGELWKDEGCLTGVPFCPFHLQHFKTILVCCCFSSNPFSPRIFSHLVGPQNDPQVRAGGRVKGVRNGNLIFQGRTNSSHQIKSSCEYCPTFLQELTHLNPGEREVLTYYQQK